MSSPVEKISAYKTLVNDYLSTVTANGEPGSLYEPIAYTLEGEGKRLRPALLLMTCEAVGGAKDTALPAAAAIELMHNFTLVHDDIMDRDDTRRGRATVHRKWDTDVALLAGDGLVALAYRHLLKTATPHLVHVAQVFTNGIIELCEGQALDREFEQRSSVCMAEYIAMITKKTARLLAVAAHLGGTIGNGAEQQVALLTQYAENLGIGFQIQDDLLDITVDQETLGKDFGSDIKRRKRTFLVIHAMQHGAPSLRRHLRQALAAPALSMDDLLKVRELFRSSGTLAAAEIAVRAYIDRARVALKLLAASAEVSDLQGLLEIVLHRNA